MNVGQQLFELVKHELDPFIEHLFEGGAFGHLAHPFEDLEMTFGQLKEMVNNILSSKIEAFEKIDGQQISFSWKGGRLIGARNKNQLKDFGKNALNARRMKDFIGKNVNIPQNVINAFYVAMVDLEKALSKIPAPTLKNMFQEGKRFMNTEIVAEETANVIPYYKDYLVFHGLIEYDVNGNPIKQIDGSGKQLEDAVNAVGESNQSKFQIKGPNKIILKNFADLPKERSIFISELKKLQGNMPDAATIEEQQEKWWKEFILKSAKEMGYKISGNVFEMLSGRWGRLEKSTNTLSKILKNIDHNQFKKWVEEYDKNEFEKQHKKNLLPYEMFFLRLGAEVLSNASGYLTASPVKTIADLAKGIQRDSLKIKQSEDLDDIKKLRDELLRLEKIGKNKIVGSEGVVFSQNGKLYKLTGVFQPVHRILSILKYKRSDDKPEVKEYAKPSVLDLDAPENPLDIPAKTANESQSSLNLINVKPNSLDGTTKTAERITEMIDKGSFDQDYARVYGKFRKEFFDNMEGKHQFKVVPADLLKNVWATFAKYGRVDENKILKIWNIIKETSMKLIIGGIVLDGKDPGFFFKASMQDFGAESLRSNFINYIHFSFTYRYDDFSRLLKSVYTADTPEELLYGIDRILNFVHDRGDIAFYLIQGGSKTLSDISNYKSKGIHLTGRLFENSVIQEGGNVVYTNSPIKNQYLEATIKNAMKIWGVGKLKYEIVGSKHKPVMNDIDLAVSIDDIGKLVKADPQDRLTFWPKVESYFKAHKPKGIPEPSFKVNKGLDQIHISAPILGEEDKFVQIDLMLGDVDFMKDMLSGAPDSVYKAFYRNLLLANILAHSHEPTKNPDVVRKYQINTKKGFQTIDLINKAGKIEKGIPKTLYNNMNDVAKFLFGPSVTFQDINTFEKLFKLLDSSSFRYKNKKSEIIDSMNQSLERMKLPPIKE